jgi:SNF2 family DNA or RNA helicase
VGLGKTIEAGLVLAQKWTEGKRRILIVCPANLRKQWSQEMGEAARLLFLPPLSGSSLSLLAVSH